MDSGQFALALEKYDITVHQPHPPGYFLYVMLGRLLYLFINDANTVFVSISVIFSGLTVVAIYYIGKDVYDKKIGIIAALIALTSPNLWFHGEVALTYIVEAFFSTAVALLCWRMLKGDHKYIWLSVIALGIAGGIRQNTMIFLLPLWLFSVKEAPLRKIVISLALFGFVCLLWFVPMVWMTGGWNAYHEAFRELWLFNTGNVSVFEKGWSTFKIFSSSLFVFTVCGIGAGILVLVLAAYSAIRHGRLRFLDSTKIYFFALWILPPVLFYILIFIHPANPGYVLIFLPALYILTAASIIYTASQFKQFLKKDLSVVMAAVVIIINLGIFFFSQYPISYREVNSHDRNLSLMLASIRTFNPLKTVIFVGPYIFYGYRQIMYYLPGYNVYQVDVRIAPTGEIRKTFWGKDKKTFLSDTISIPISFDTLLIPLIANDKDKVTEMEGITIYNLNHTNMYIAIGNITLIKNIYPELRVNFKSSLTELINEPKNSSNN
jgi:hypothetical protein